MPPCVQHTYATCAEQLGWCRGGIQTGAAFAGVAATRPWALNPAATGRNPAEPDIPPFFSSFYFLSLIFLIFLVWQEKQFGRLQLASPPTLLPTAFEIAMWKLDS